MVRIAEDSVEAPVALPAARVVVLGGEAVVSAGFGLVVVAACCILVVSFVLLRRWRSKGGAQRAALPSHESRRAGVRLPNRVLQFIRSGISRGYDRVPTNTPDSVET